MASRLLLESGAPCAGSGHSGREVEIWGRTVWHLMEDVPGHRGPLAVSHHLERSVPTWMSEFV